MVKIFCSSLTSHISFKKVRRPWQGGKLHRSWSHRSFKKTWRGSLVELRLKGWLDFYYCLISLGSRRVRNCKDTEISIHIVDTYKLVIIGFPTLGLLHLSAEVPHCCCREFEALDSQQCPAKSLLSTLLHFFIHHYLCGVPPCRSILYPNAWQLFKLGKGLSQE